MKDEIEHILYDLNCERERIDLVVHHITEVFIKKLEEIKKDMEGCTGEDCQYPLNKAINELK